MKEQFCESQIKCKEDNPYTWTCTAHLNEGRAFPCRYKNFADSKSGQYPCLDAREVKIPVAKYEKKEGECDRCRTRMERICSSDGAGLKVISWCKMCGAIQVSTRYTSIYNTVANDCTLEFEYPEMTADLPCDNS